MQMHANFVSFTLDKMENKQDHMKIQLKKYQADFRFEFHQ